MSKNYLNKIGIKTPKNLEINNKKIKKINLNFPLVLKILSNKLGFRLITSPSSIKIPSQISATIAFKYGLNKLNSNYCIIIGENESKDNSVQIKNMNTGNQESVSVENIANYLKTELRI